MTRTRTHAMRRLPNGKGYLHRCHPHPWDNSGTLERWFQFQKDKRGKWTVAVANTRVGLENGYQACYGEWDRLQDALDWYNKEMGVGRNCKLVKYRSQR